MNYDKMPYDTLGREIKQGDIVSIDCRVTAVSASPDSCLIAAEPVEVPPGEPKPTLTLDSRLFQKIEREDGPEYYDAMQQKADGTFKITRPEFQPLSED